MVKVAVAVAVAAAASASAALVVFKQGVYLTQGNVGFCSGTTTMRHTGMVGADETFALKLSFPLFH